MKFVIRDDDTCAFTRPEELLASYRPLIQTMPVSLSVTPFRVPGAYHFVPESLYGSTNPIALDTNAELVSFLQESVSRGQVDIAIHGYHHDVYDGLPEYIAGGDLKAKTQRAKDYLSKLFGKEIKTFVPPHNSIGKEGLRAVIQASLNLVNIPSLWSWKVRDPSFESYLKMPELYWHRKIRGRSYPFVLQWADHKEVAYHTVGPGSIRNQMIDEFDYCHATNGVYVLATHYHAFDFEVASGGTVRELVYELVDRASGRPGVSFVGINDIW